MITDIIVWILAIVTSMGGSGDADIWQYEPTPAVWVQVEEVPAVAPDSCVTITYEWLGTTAVKTGSSFVKLEPWEVRTDIVGRFLWVQFDHDREHADSLNDVSSIPLTLGSSQVEVCR